MKHLLITFLVLLTACNKKDDLELEIVTKQINSLNIKSNEFHKYFNDNNVNPNAKTIVVYKLINNTNKTYYFNLDGYNKDLQSKSIRMDRAYVSITDNNNQIAKCLYCSPTLGSTLPKDFEILNQLNYNFTRKYKNFIIHPNETLYFEWFLVLPYGNQIEFGSYWVDLDAKKKYFAELLLYSDGVNYKREISRTDLQTIQDNGYEVYNGTIKSKNKVSIVFNEP